MGLQLSAKGEILIDGKPPKGWRDRLWAWIVLWQANRAMKEAVARKDLSPEQKASQDRDESMRICRRRQFYNALTCVCAIVQVPICAFSGWEHHGFWRWICFVAAPFFVYRAVKDWKVFWALREEERRLVVDEVHDF